MVSSRIPYQSMTYEETLSQRKDVHHMVVTIVVIVFFLLLTSCFSLPGRSGTQKLGSLDWIAMLKIFTRITSFTLLSLAVYMLWHNPRTPVVLKWLQPFLIFISIGIISTFWSPMKAASFGHAMEFVVYLMIAFCVGIIATNNNYIAILIGALTTFYLMLAAFGIYAHYFIPSIIDLKYGGDAGFIHPGQGGRMAVCSLIMIMVSYYLWGWKWAKYMMIPALIIQFTFLIMAMRRTPLLVLSLFLFSFFLWKGNKRFNILFLLLTCFLGFLYLLVDPYLTSITQAWDFVVEYVTRGQTEEQIMELSGRHELWNAIWDGFLNSPILGYGYGIGSPSGTLDVWHKEQFVAAHNLFLQVLISNGLLGFLPFMWGMIRPLYASVRSLKHPRTDERFKTSVYFLSVYFAFILFGMFSSCFIVQVEQANFTFFLAYGILIGRLDSHLIDNQAQHEHTGATK